MKWHEKEDNSFLSISHMTTLSIVLCFKASLAADLSPPPIVNTVFDLLNHFASTEIKKITVNIVISQK